MSEPIAAKRVYALHIHLLGYVKNELANLIVPLSGRALVVSHQDEDVLAIYLLVVKVVLHKPYSAVLLNNDLRRKVGGVELHHVVCLKLVHHVLSNELSHMTHTWKPLYQYRTLWRYLLDCHHSNGHIKPSLLLSQKHSPVFSISVLWGESGRSR